MMFPELDTDYDDLAALADTIAIAPAAPINPLPCDRWVARSCLQKATRRAEPELAQRALANLFEHDRRATWRHLTIIALEDVGVANVDVLSRIVAAQRNRQWRQQQGGDWLVMTELVRQMAASDHCQAACDLLLRVLNDPALDVERATALDHDAADHARTLWDRSCAIATKGVAALALGGGLAEGQQLNDPCGVFDIMMDAGMSPHVVATCRAAWKISRNPMALLMPLVQEHRPSHHQHFSLDDVLPPANFSSGVPGYALDQFTRGGNVVSRALLEANFELREHLRAAGVPFSRQARVVGDVIFLLEGGRVRHRMIWPLGESLRLPHRWLPAVAQLGPHIVQTLRLIEAKARQLDYLRSEHLSSLASHTAS